MDLDQAAPKGQSDNLGTVCSGFIVFASMIKYILKCMSFCSRSKKQATFSGHKIVVGNSNRKPW